MVEHFDEPQGEARKSAESASKPRLDLLPPPAMEAIAEVLTFGALFAWWRGQDLDPETGLSHLAHAGCCLVFLMEYQRNGWGTDDRFRGSDGEQFQKGDANA